MIHHIQTSPSFSMDPTQENKVPYFENVRALYCLMVVGTFQQHEIMTLFFQVDYYQSISLLIKK